MVMMLVMMIIVMIIIVMVYTLCIMPRESRQNEAGRSHRPVAFYLMKLQEYRSDKNSF